jgi:hypothetical protein
MIRLSYRRVRSAVSKIHFKSSFSSSEDPGFDGAARALGLIRLSLD